MSPKVKVVLRESGHVGCVLSGNRLSLVKPGQRIISESADGVIETLDLVAPSKSSGFELKGSPSSPSKAVSLNK